MSEIFIISDIVSVGDIAILKKNRWPSKNTSGTDINPNGTIVAIIKGHDDSAARTEWFNTNVYKQFFSVNKKDIDDYLLVVLPHEPEYQYFGYNTRLFCYSETTFLNRRCVVTIPALLQQISPSGLFNKKRIALNILRETGELPTRRERI